MYPSQCEVVPLCKTATSMACVRGSILYRQLPSYENITDSKHTLGVYEIYIIIHYDFGNIRHIYIPLGIYIPCFYTTNARKPIKTRLKWLKRGSGSRSDREVGKIFSPVASYTVLTKNPLFDPNITFCDGIGYFFFTLAFCRWMIPAVSDVIVP